MNSSVNAESDGVGADAVVVGKKIRRIKNQICFLERESLDENWDLIRDILRKAVVEQKYSRIYLIYNHYHNMSSIECVKKLIFPIEMADTEQSEKGDFITMGDATEVLQSMVITYLEFETGMAAVSSYASENISRRNATTDSLKKIDEMEEEEMWDLRKERSQKAFKKVIDSYIKKKGYGGSGR